MPRLIQERRDRHKSCQAPRTPSHLAEEKEQIWPQVGSGLRSFDPPLGTACAGTDLGQPGATGSLVNQAFEASASSLGGPEHPELLAAGVPPPWSGVSRADWGLIYRAS